MTPPSSDTQLQIPDRRWQELCAHIRFTDDVSFKLLAFVPLVSVASFAVSLVKNEPKFGPSVVLLSLFAAAITLALWIWERRNIQNCLWFRARAAALEADVLGASVPGHFYAFPDAPAGFGKTEAERLVYGLAIGAWLLLPLTVFVSDPSALSSQAGRWGASGYAVMAVALGLYACRVLRIKIDLQPKYPDK